ncbi:MAG: DUF2227 family putative metal-binding protein [Cyanobacteria bacterium P01_F01_bin.150]
MSSGKVHDFAGKATVGATLPIAVVYLPVDLAICYGLFSILGFTHLGPDLDSNNFRANTIRRWGRAKWLWYPFNRLVSPHRGPTHVPLLGAALVLFWLLLLTGAVGLIAVMNGWVSLPSFEVRWLWYLFVAFVAVAIQHVVHLAFDGYRLCQVAVGVGGAVVLGMIL